MGNVKRCAMLCVVVPDEDGGAHVKAGDASCSAPTTSYVLQVFCRGYLEVLGLSGAVQFVNVACISKSGEHHDLVRSNDIGDLLTGLSREGTKLPGVQVEYTGGTRW
jgi:hypothetical protein